MAYSEKLVKHFENPQNVGTISADPNDKEVGTGLVGAPACGDVMKLQIKVDDDGNIVDSCFKTFGCGSAIASSSLATEWVKGRTLDDVVEIKNSDIAKHLSLPPVKLHCSMLAEDAIKVRYAGECAGAVLRVGEPEKLTQPCSFFLPAVWDTAFSTEGRGEGLEAEE